jgi:FkbM family methyltransferase
MFPISSILPPLPRIKIVDIGAMTAGKGTEPYACLVTAASCDVIGFEPVTAELEKLDAQKDADRRFLPHVIGDGSTRIFHECNFTMTSSLFEPNTALVDKFQNLGELMQVTRTYPVQTKRLDDIPEMSGTDFLKVDVQGAEVLVFDGAAETLKDVLVIESEVCFAPLYKHQCLFSDIDIVLRSRGFAFHRLNTVSGRAFKPLIVNNDVNAMMSQWLWGDAIYVRDFTTFDRLPPPALLKLAVIMHENYGSFDLAASALEAHDRQTGSDLQPRYIQRLVRPSG